VVEEAKLEELKAEHGEVHVLTAGGNVVVIKRPTKPMIERWQDACTTDKKRGPKATATLVRECVVHPAPSVYDAMIEERPLLPMTFGEKVLEIAGAIQDCEAKKA
jgi:hypothetical protein